MWYVYILECNDGSLYTGITNNIEKRFAEHTGGKGGHYTSSRGAKKIVYSEKYATKGGALKREAEIKSWRKKKKHELLTNGLMGFKIE